MNGVSILPTNSSTPNRPWRTTVVAAVLLVEAALATAVFRHAGTCLVREDALSRADAILVLSGSMPYRAEEAAKLFRQGYAPEVWITRPAAPLEQMQTLGVHYVGEEEYNREILVHEGVPEADIQILPGEIINTEQEIDEASQEMQREGKSSVLVVTSPQHTRRVRALWDLLAGKSQRAIVRAAPDDPFDAAHWWRNTRDALSVTREYLGLLNAWAGLPIRPHTDTNQTHGD